MTDFYSRMAATASRLLTAYGQSTVIQRTTPGTFDPVTGAETGETTANHTGVAVQIQIKQNLIDGTRIQAGDRMYAFDNSKTPILETDKIKVDSEYWSIVDIKTVKPAATALVSFVQVRK